MELNHQRAMEDVPCLLAASANGRLAQLVYELISYDLIMDLRLGAS
jgi:hypothetical protein